MTVDEIVRLTPAEAGGEDNVVRLRCADGRGWVSLRSKAGQDLFQQACSAFAEEDDAPKAFDDDDEESWVPHRLVSQRVPVLTGAWCALQGWVGRRGWGGYQR